MTLRLGALELVAPVGRGGMAEVWSARRDDGLPVAVKVLAPCRDAVAAERFRSEVRAMAGLDHPNIAAVYDYGEVPAEAGGRLRPRSPYLVMELIEGGSLREAAARDARALVATLRAVLDALAHAHARGVVHRDLKPANLLRATDGRIKLTDFGIAHALERGIGDTASTLYAGTPEYMAPEQAQGHWRDFGPWTDLYALGCVAWALACGRPPFRGGTSLSTLRAQMQDSLPEFAPQVPLPAGFEAWVRRLLQKRPAHRFQRAADALAAMAGWAPLATGAFAAPADDLPTALEAGTAAWDAAPAATQVFASQPMVDGLASPEAPPAAAPVWVVPAATAGTVSGLALFGLRVPPLFGREAECRRLGAALEQVREAGRPAALVLRGPAGVGKSRLAEWLGERAHETGFGTPLRAFHAEGAEADGLATMLRRHFRADGLDRAAAAARVAGVLGELGVAHPDEAAALTEVFAPASDAERATGERLVRLAGAGERHAVVRRHLERLAEARAVVVWLDDVQWSADALAFARHVLAQGSGPVLLVLTARDEALDERPDEARLLAALPATTVEVPPLDADSQRRLISALLPVDAKLADEIARRSGGNPLFAAQIARHFAEGGEGALPTTLHEAWDARVEALLAGRAADDARALEVAAVLGPTVDEAEWHAACAAAQAWVSPSLLETMLHRRLARAAEGRWTFAHGLLREAILRRARDAGRLSAHHRACARALGEAPAPERLARHLLGAGDAAAAVALFTAAVRRLLAAGEYLLAESTVDERDRALAALRLPDEAQAAPGGPRAPAPVSEANRERLHIEGRLLRLRALIGRGAFDEGHALSLAIEAEAKARGWRLAEAEALLRRSFAEFERARFAAGLGDVARARALLEGMGERVLEAACAQSAGHLYLASGQMDAAEAEIHETLRIYEEIGDERKLGHAILNLALVARQRGALDRAEALARQARETQHRSGSRLDEADALHALAEVARMRGQLDSAEQGYRAARDLYEATGSAYRDVSEINLGLVLLERGAFPAAAEGLRRVLATAVRLRRPVLEAVCKLFLLPCIADAGDWDVWDSSLAEATGYLESRGLYEADQARIARLAADVAAAAGQPERAAAARAFAARQYRGLGREAEAAALE